MGYGTQHFLPLPSGNKVRVRRVSLLTQVRLKQIPPELIGVVWSVFGRDDAPNPVAGLGDEQRINTMIALMDAAIKPALVDIKIVDGEIQSETTVDDEGFTCGTVNIADLPDTDKALIFGFVMGNVNADPIVKEVERDLAAFPGESARPAAGSRGKKVRDQAKHDDPAEPKVESVAQL
jgi:hypothetical protein